MSTRNFITLFERDLTTLAVEISLFSKEENIWLVSGEITNSAGNLCLHLVGNLSHFVAKEIGGFDYTRNREFEFNRKDVPRTDLLASIEKVKKQVTVSLEGLAESALDEDYTLEVFGSKMTNSYFLIHLYGHLNYHLGQINYHRRLLDK